MGKLNEFFDEGKLTIVMDGGAGSSGKGKISSYLTENADNWQFACNTFGPQAGHWVKLDNGKSYFYQTLNSCAYQHEKFEKLYLGPGCIIELPALLREMEENGIPRSKIGISPIIPILSKIDSDFEQGLAGFDGAPQVGRHDGTAKSGSTAHGVGSVMARRALRRPTLTLARDVPELKDMICDVPTEICDRLEKGQRGLLEIAQGFQLSNQHSTFYPFVTSRNVTVAQGLSDMFLPPVHAGQVIINFRTFPIRINSNKYLCSDTGAHLTWADVQAGKPHKVYEGDSGPWYPDQQELTWEALTEFAGAPEKIFEMTSVTKLPRRVATFSQQNVDEAIRYNQTGYPVHISLNFLNYVDHAITGKREYAEITMKVKQWLLQNMVQYNQQVKFLGTGANTEDTIYLG